MSTHTDTKLEELKAYIRQAKGKDHPESQLIGILHKTQHLYGYLDPKVMDEIALELNVPTSHIWGVATFYHYFNLTPPGKHSIYACLGTACYVKGAEKVLDEIKKELKIGIGQTTEDGLFTLRETRCLGACGLAPVIMIDDKMYGELTPQSVVEILRSYAKKNT